VFSCVANAIVPLTNGLIRRMDEFIRLLNGQSSRVNGCSRLRNGIVRRGIRGSRRTYFSPPRLSGPVFRISSYPKRLPLAFTVKFGKNAPIAFNPNAAIEGRRPASIPALGNAQGTLSPAMKGLKARHQIVRKPDSRWSGPSALVVFLVPNLGRRSCLALAQADIRPGLRPSNAAFGFNIQQRKRGNRHAYVGAILAASLGGGR